jgi:hypothetical protein
MPAEGKRNRKKSSVGLLGDIAPSQVEWFWLCCNCGDGFCSEYIEACPNYACYHTRCNGCHWEEHEVRLWDSLAPSTPPSGSRTVPRADVAKTKSYTAPPNLSSDQNGQSANLSPLSMSAMKDDLVKHLKLSPETYSLMAVRQFILPCAIACFGLIRSL